MGEMDDTTLAAAWIVFAKRLDTAEAEHDGAGSSDSGDEYERAGDTVLMLPYDDPDRAYALCLEIAGRTDDPWVLGLMGAGPLETLIRADPRGVLDRLLHDVAGRPGLREALHHVWNSNLPEDLQRQLAALRGRTN